MSGADRSDIHARCSLFMEEVSSAFPRDGNSKSMSIAKQRFEMNASRNEESEDHQSVTFEMGPSQLHSPAQQNRRYRSKIKL
jgi:hypothetical protein